MRRLDRASQRSHHRAPPVSATGSMYGRATHRLPDSPPPAAPRDPSASACPRTSTGASRAAQPVREHAPRRPSACGWLASPGQDVVRTSTSACQKDPLRTESGARVARPIAVVATGLVYSELARASESTQLRSGGVLPARCGTPGPHGHLDRWQTGAVQSALCELHLDRLHLTDGAVTATGKAQVGDQAA